jgi:hypothetical protein
MNSTELKKIGRYRTEFELSRKNKVLMPIYMPPIIRKKFNNTCKKRGYTATQVLTEFCRIYGSVTDRNNKHIKFLEDRLIAPEAAQVLTTIAVSEKLWKDVMAIAKCKGLAGRKVLANQVVLWIRRPKKMKCWPGRKRRNTVKLRLTQEATDKFKELCESKEINQPMAHVVEGLLREWVTNQRRRKHHWNIDPYGV